MTDTPANQAHETAEGGELDGRDHAPEENDLSHYRVELESLDGGIRRVHYVDADSVEDAVVKVRADDHWPSSGPGSDPDRFRAVDVTEVTETSEVRHQRNARRRYLNTIVEAGLTALGESSPTRSDQEFFDVLCDFFTRTVVRPGHFPLTTTVCGAGTTPPSSWRDSSKTISPTTA
ncbi:hypothetical protein [Saccharopolyspora gloriosae]|uniref:hypothetical protein n=1 Tax=Saccharopolyspora gloriosae TaxID=455344 RepID=UPI001FB71DA3|nr:hypothetical protein [Saccharopolyspora gloriosae]